MIKSTFTSVGFVYLMSHRKPLNHSISLTDTTDDRPGNGVISLPFLPVTFFTGEIFHTCYTPVPPWVLTLQLGPPRAAVFSLCHAVPSASSPHLCLFLTPPHLCLPLAPHTCAFLLFPPLPHLCPYPILTLSPFSFSFFSFWLPLSC